MRIERITQQTLSATALLGAEDDEDDDEDEEDDDDDGDDDGRAMKSRSA